MIGNKPKYWQTIEIKSTPKEYLNHEKYTIREYPLWPLQRGKILHKKSNDRIFNQGAEFI